jgi:Fe-S cluster assembly protein SufD
LGLRRDPAGAGLSLLTGTLEVTSARREAEVASLQELPPSAIAFQHRHAVIGEGATLHWALAQLGSRLVRSRVDNRLEGDRSSVEQVEIVFGGSDQLFDLTSYTRHVGRDTTGNLLSKGALMDKSRSFMKGMIVIDRSAVGTDSFLGEFGMNLSKQTRSVAIPSLEIDQPDCRRAAHSSSVGPIDEAQLFYLESRGIPPDEARKFIVLGFSSRSWRGSRWPTRRIGSADSSRPSGTPGPARGRSAQRETDRPARGR